MWGLIQLSPFFFGPQKSPFFVPSFMKIYHPKKGLEKSTLNQPDVKLLSSLFNKINKKKGQIVLTTFKLFVQMAQLTYFLGKFTSNPKSLTLTLTPSYTLVGELWSDDSKILHAFWFYLCILQFNLPFVSNDDSCMILALTVFSLKN